jgi:hypothetical protein
MKVRTVHPDQSTKKPQGEIVMSIRSTAFVFASLLAIAAAPLTAHAAQAPLPGQPGADTSLDQELRAQPYLASTERSQHVKVADPMTTAQIGKSIYGSLSLPANLVFN